MNTFRQGLIIAFLTQSILLTAQSIDLKQFNQNRLDFNKRAMTILGSWAVGNMVLSGVLVGRTEGVNKAFHQMNIGWNAVNLSIAAFGYWGAIRSNPSELDAFQTLKAHTSNEKIFLFNTGLDVAYMIGGFWMIERSKNTTKNPGRLNGFGKAVVMNGAFLFAFDIGAYLLQQQKFGQLKPLVSNNGLGLVWVF